MIDDSKKMSTSYQNVAIIGGTGQLGQYLTREFLSQGSFKVKVLTRTESKATELQEEFRKKGAEIIQVDYEDQGSIISALQNTHVLISALGSYDLFENQERFINAAKEAGVSRFIPSEFGTDVEGNTSPFFAPKVKTREVLETSGLEYTYYINGFFIEHLLVPHLGFDIKNSKVSIIGKGETKISVTSLNDVAKFVVGTINLPQARNNKLIITGDETTLLDIANNAAKIKAKSIEIEYIPIEKAHAILADESTDGLTKVLTGLRLEIENGGIFNKGNDASLVNGLKPVTVREYIQDNL
ncbi:hypothetical protein DSO57_1028765 [Entomophthora muscae]|uniref:Uncharacterized protein n=2 Tax=Entomophthora muscae TaxID=34485 RepID=A0ACC2S0R8_9FUNG|nr:hypothetical protein DSO57_1038002 [Entomophthora muscae]KAJ9060631.1 hypothetical protein DSO57_1028765 [Entomophthora muscae]